MHQLLYRIVMIPVIAAVSYELLKLSDAYEKSFFLLRLLTMPGALIQRITTQEPSDAQIEVARRALRGLLTAQAEKG